MIFKFEQIDNYHQRAKVPGGWLVKAYEDVMHNHEQGNQNGLDWRVSMTFVPDPEHSWLIDLPCKQD